AMERQAAREIPGREPVTDLGKQNAETRERNRMLETARKAVEKAQELFSGLEKKARQAVGLARKIGQRMEREREAEIRRQQDIRAAEEARKAAEKDRQKQLAKEIEEPTFRRSRDRGPSIG
ncbi:conjugal transfer protein TraA, partial [Acetobacter senegalensis]|nr:conjugal transfer protein TraA [Acetobacter senegalensis]